MVAGKPIRGSVTKRIFLSFSENWTRLTAVLNSHDFKHVPFETSQSLAVLSADPETKRVDVAIHHQDISPSECEFVWLTPSLGEEKLNETRSVVLNDLQLTSTVQIVPTCPS